MLSCDAYLTRQSCKVIKIKQDGNCFYASLSFQLFGTQDEDFEVRHVVTSMVKKTKVFSDLILFQGKMWIRLKTL